MRVDHPTHAYAPSLSAIASHPWPASTQDETYEFPYVLACFFPGEGCGMADKSTDLCVSNALEFATVQDHKFEKQDGIVVESMVCVCACESTSKMYMCIF